MPRTRLSPDRRALVERFIPLAVKITKRYAANRGLNPWDLFSVAFEALVDYAEDFEPGRGTAKGYFGAKVAYALIDHARADGLRRTRLPIEGFVPAEHPECGDPKGRELMRQEVEWLLSTTQEAPVLRLRFLEGMTQDEVAKALRIPPSTVNLRVRRGLGRIRSFASRVDWTRGMP